MGPNNSSDDEVHSPDDIYEDSDGAGIEQSAIYEGVHFPCINEKVYTIVLTPRCDIYWSKADYIIMGGLVTAQQIFRYWLLKNKRTPPQIAGEEPLRSKNKVEKIHETFVHDYIGNRELRYHFLPSFKDRFPHSFVDFQLVESFNQNYITGLKKIAVLKSPWRESVPTRYAAYSGRIGTEDYSKQLVDEIMNQISDLTWVLTTNTP